MIGPANRVHGVHTPRIETSLDYTVPGQATWADPTIPHTCGECGRWAVGKRKDQGRCLEYSARMQGRQGPLIGKRQQACGAFEPAL